MDGDFKRKVEQAATIQLSAPFLKIPQAMRAAGFMDKDSKSAAKQMQVRRARDAMRKSTPTKAMTVTVVLSRCLPAASDSSVSTLTTASPSVVSPLAGGGAAVLPVLYEGVKDNVPAPPVLEKVRLTVGASIKVVRNKKN
jgi:hypothetical protein